MKLNKPEVTESQTVLEDYVVSLLLDPSKKSKQVSQTELTAVAKINENKTRRTQAETTADEKVILKQIVSDVIPLKQKLAKPELSSPHKANQIETSTEESRIEPVVHQAEIKKVERNKQSKDEKQSEAGNIKNKLPNKPDVTAEKEVEFESTNNRARVDKEQSNKIQQKHRQKINQEIEAHSHQESRQKRFKNKNEKDPRLQGVEKLLAKIALAKVVEPNKADSQDRISTQAKPSVEVTSKDLSEVELANSQASFAHREKQPLKDILGNVFQTLVFEVGKLPLAVPLIKLGGIVNVSEQDITPLVGTPDWFMGLVPHEKGNLMVVDTQQFLMPEQENDQQQTYKYLILLDDSMWALACHSVGDAKNLSPEDIRWSSGSSRRPWFAGMVVEYMSALIEVDRLINMLTDNIVD